MEQWAEIRRLYLVKRLSIKEIVRRTGRDGHGGEAWIKQARFPARKTLEEFDFSFQRSVQKTLVLHGSSTSCTPART